MQLILLRHGKATGIDHDAELIAQGRAQVEATCEQLRSFGVTSSTRLIHSGLLRAEQTAEIAARILSIQTSTADPRFLPDADPNIAIEFIEAIAAPLLIVTHQPLVSHVASRLLGDGTVQFDTATAAVLSRTSGSWRLEHVAGARHD